jgi:hypothetical protein
VSGIAYLVPGNKPDLQILVDDDDWRELNVMDLSFQAVPRPRRTMDDDHHITFKHGLLHRFLIKQTADNGFVVDHINHSALDNRRANLRVTTEVHNGQNKVSVSRSTFKGVSGSEGKWVARIMQHGQTFKIGSFPTREIAAYAYNQRALELYGPQAYVNPGISKPDGWVWRLSKLVRDEEA